VNVFIGEFVANGRGVNFIRSILDDIIMPVFYIHKLLQLYRCYTSPFHTQNTM
jgi:hypothetical protein